MIRAILAVIALCFWIGSATAQTAPEPRPAIWLIEDGDTRIYLFGTFHILPTGFRWRSAQFDRIAREADELVMEIANVEDAREDEALRAPLLLGKQASALWRVSPERRQALGEIIAASGLPRETLDGLQTWAIAMALGAAGMVQAYTEPGRAPSVGAVEGVEPVLQREFAASHRPISGVETASGQLGFFASLSFAEQRRLLESLVDAYQAAAAGTLPSEPRADHARWAAGDADSLSVDQELSPTLYDILITRRNRAWTDWLVDRLRRPGTVLFAVGAGHLAGPDSVQSMLAARGVTVTRVGDR